MKAERLILQEIAGILPRGEELRHLLRNYFSHAGRKNTLRLRQQLVFEDQSAIAEILDVLPVSGFALDFDQTHIVVLSNANSTCVGNSSQSSNDCTLSRGSPLIFLYEEQEISPPETLTPQLSVSASLRAALDVVSTKQLLCFGVAVEIAVDASREPENGVQLVGVSSLNHFIELRNASNFHQVCKFTDDLNSKAIVCGTEGDNVFDLLSSIFAPIPDINDGNCIVAIKVAPILPFGYRKARLPESLLWKGVHEYFQTFEPKGIWLKEGHIITVRKKTSVDPNTLSENLIEDLMCTIHPSGDVQFNQKPEMVAVHCEIVSVVTRGELHEFDRQEFSQLGSGYFTSKTKFEVGDISEGVGLLRVPYDSISSFYVNLSPAKTLLKVLQQCIQFQASYEDNFSESNYSISFPSLQTIVVHGEESNCPFVIVQSVVESVLLPFTVFDCRSGKTNASDGSQNLVVEKIFDGCVFRESDEEATVIQHPMVLIVRHAQLIEEETSLREIKCSLESLKGYLIVIFCHERSDGTPEGKVAQNSASDTSSAGPKGLARLSSWLSISLVGTVYCGVPSESDRVVILEHLFRQGRKMLDSFPWEISLTCSSSLIASWTVGFSVMDLIAFVTMVVQEKKSKFRTSLLTDSSFILLLSDEDFFMGLSEYQQSHGLIVSSTKLQPVKWSDVGGLHEAKKEILETIQLPTKYPHLFKAGGMQRKMGILLFGPPGCGKTLLAKAVATEMSMNFLSVKGPELINQYVGESEKNVRDIFQRARDNAPCVLFFDELDALAPARGAKGDAGGAMDRIVSQLLVEMDGVDKGGGDVFIVAATNRPDMLDASLLRPGRFDQRCYLGPPEGVEEKLLALRALTRKFSLADDVDLHSIAKELDVSGKYTGADLFALCSDAMLFAVEERVAFLKDEFKRIASEGDNTDNTDALEGAEVRVTKAHFERALAQLKPSVTHEEFQKYESLRSSMDK